MQLENRLLIWEQYNSRVTDIRYLRLNADYQYHCSVLPSSVFLFAEQGSASVTIDDKQFYSSPFHVLHLCKGSRLQLERRSECGEFSCYMVYYKASAPFPPRRYLAELMKRGNPFSLQYGLVPVSPSEMLGRVEEMRRSWDSGLMLERFRVKGLFYTTVYEVLSQLESVDEGISHVDPVALAVRYLNDHYKDNAGIQNLARRLGWSPRHLTRRFKETMGLSPVEYLTWIRMAHAGKLLLHSGFGLQAIAEAIGYSDSYHFAKMFKKHVGIAPMRFRKANNESLLRLKMPSLLSHYDIAVNSKDLYIGYDNHYQYKGEKMKSMKVMNKSSIMLALMISLTLLLGACSGVSTNGAAGNSSSTAPAQTAAAIADPAAQPESATRVIKTVKGDVEVPRNPERVVVLYLLGDVLSLGIVPVGVSSVYEGAAFQDRLSDIQSLGEWFEPSPEAVLALAPDLIIVPSEETYDMLKDIAPTVYLPYFEMSTEERLSMLGEVLSREGESKALMENFLAKVEESKIKLKEAGILDKTVSIMEGGKGNMAVVDTINYGRGSQIIYEYLGMKGPEKLQHNIETLEAANAQSISFEVLHEYAGDYIFRSSYDGMVDLSDHTIWNNIPAVKEGRLIEISFGLSYYNDIYSLDKQLDFIVESLLATQEQ
ncbi:hypothetical protein A7K91_25160 [Paenibacillus oryzae]|uniref:AraC family transcriptional regulator n=1 Tax=Paenibacillus oryzae TaxID=1844972 RepID=A0A1A5YCC1_9BACL|nr:AraC family transcriptional regulator [Paenibacillus oryzae]OBR63242.1 hypothetical protein A7K91_25160 [Paenibacillus oryzae]